MGTQGQELAETYLKMLNTHNPDLVDQFEAENALPVFQQMGALPPLGGGFEVRA